MDEKNDGDLMLPGFRFHPTDEELVVFYLKRKIQQRPLPIELIKQVDIYKYNPWDLPKLASTGEKEWYFYCPRDRKYRNSARPNRVTGAGFWKATGTDRPIYSSDGTRCIGLKKSLVFYRGRAAKGIKTDWMMHEFRLPSTFDSTQSKKLLDKHLPVNESWAICRIFKKISSMTQRVLSHSWILSPTPDTASSDMFTTQAANSTYFSSENVPSTTDPESAIQLCSGDVYQQGSPTGFPILDISSIKTMTNFSKTPPLPILNGELPTGFLFSTSEVSGSSAAIDASPMLFNISPAYMGEASKTSESIDFEGPHQQFNSFSFSTPQSVQGSFSTEEGDLESTRDQNASGDQVNHWESLRSVGFPFSLPPSNSWKPNLPWDSPPCPSDMSSSVYPTTKCYT